MANSPRASALPTGRARATSATRWARTRCRSSSRATACSRRAASSAASPPMAAPPPSRSCSRSKASASTAARRGCRDFDGRPPGPIAAGSGRDALGLADRDREQAGAADVADLDLGARAVVVVAALEVERDQLGELPRLFGRCKIAPLVVIMHVGFERDVEEKPLHLPPFVVFSPLVRGLHRTHARYYRRVFGTFRGSLRVSDKDARKFARRIE